MLNSNEMKSCPLYWTFAICMQILLLFSSFMMRIEINKQKRLFAKCGVSFHVNECYALFHLHNMHWSQHSTKCTINVYKYVSLFRYPKIMEWVGHHFIAENVYMILYHFVICMYVCTEVFVCIQEIKSDVWLY